MRGFAMAVLAAWLTVPGCTALTVVAPGLMGRNREAVLGAAIIVGGFLFLVNLAAVWAAAYLFGREAPPVHGPLPRPEAPRPTAPDALARSFRSSLADQAEPLTPEGRLMAAERAAQRKEPTL